MKRGEIWQVQGRLVLIVSPEPFSRITKVPVVPIRSGGNSARTAGFAVGLTESKTTGVVRCEPTARPRPRSPQRQQARKRCGHSHGRSAGKDHADIRVSLSSV